MTTDPPKAAPRKPDRLFIILILLAMLVAVVDGVDVFAPFSLLLGLIGAMFIAIELTETRGGRLNHWLRIAVLALGLTAAIWHFLQ
ncbi:MAG TPA: hypothetical protein VD886_23170 [Herpetosiphonaceae bacterium]|nr:hypothetical protein [Herpetosiphonaceae bacterium]